MRMAKLAGLIVAMLALPALAAIPGNGGPYNARFTADGGGLARTLEGAEELVAAGARYGISGWVRPDAKPAGMAMLIVLGDEAGKCRCLAIHQGYPMVLDGPTTITARKRLAAGKWTHVAMVSDGATLRLYVGGKLAGSTPIRSGPVPARIALAPRLAGFAHFGGAIAGATVDGVAPTEAEVAAAAAAAPDFAAITGWLGADS
ncbi:LamG domain-containing protein [Sphingomonas canadensis]|uniref:LamG domain-containing protein n=1 Tax=Sphingomonas canadensis TaxID=1219257 RepID=A0ABW3HBB4_9SPHN|nr:LamG domain-containing protein [Sphingomonas canadensis]MCW3838281.1 LamG domain-containing protein [Sphingomonas canadensis]